jgi:hypothetical protein
MEHIKKISVYDFDKTLARTPENTIENRQLWEKHHGRPWPHRGNGWWAKDESLDINVFNVELNDEVKNAAILDINAFDVHAVLLTGRIGRFSSSVKEVCRRGGLPYFNDYYFNDSDNTLKFKLAKMEMLKTEFSKATVFEMWEDREAHIPHFIDWGKENYGDNFIIHIIK